MERLNEEDLDHMPIGFEVAFPSLVEIARSIDLNIPFNCPGLEEIHKRKSLKLKKFSLCLSHLSLSLYMFDSFSPFNL